MNLLRAACEEVILSLKGEDDPFADDPELGATPRRCAFRRASAASRRSWSSSPHPRTATLEDEIATLCEPDASTMGEETSLRPAAPLRIVERKMVLFQGRFQAFGGTLQPLGERGDARGYAP